MPAILCNCPALISLRLRHDLPQRDYGRSTDLMKRLFQQQQSRWGGGGVVSYSLLFLHLSLPSPPHG